MKSPNGICCVTALLLWLLGPAPLFGQIEDLIGAVVQVAVEDDAEAEDDDEDSGVTREVTVEVEANGKKTTVTQTVDGDFVGEIVDGDDTTTFEAESLDELEEKFPDAHAAFTAAPANPAAKAGAAANISVQMTDNNGDRKVEVKEPGRKLILRDLRGKDLRLTVKRDLEHGTRTEQYDAPDAEALKKKFPEMAQLYQQHLGGAAAGAGVFNLQVQGGAAIPFGAPPAANVGPRKIVGEHNGQKIVIRDENGKNIRITLTKTADGKTSTEEFQAEDLAALKKDHPELARTYEKLAGKGVPQGQPFGIINGNAGPIRIQLQAGPPIAVQAVPEPVERPFAPGQAAQQLQLVRSQLEVSRKRLEKLAADKQRADSETLQQLADEIAAIAKKLAELDAKPKK